MEDESSKKYVVELLKQLEELKRKKAQKVKKLQKLKKVNIEGTKGQSSKVLGQSKSYSSSNVNTDSVRSNSSSVDKLKKDENYFSNISKSSITSNPKNNKIQNENQSLHAQELKSNKDASNLSIELPKCNQSTAFGKDVVNSSDMTVKNESHEQNSETKSSFSALKSNERQNCTAYDSLCNDDIVSNKIEKENVILNSSNCTNHKTVDNLNEISNGSKRKSPDLLDESLNSNMSCFLSSDLFSAIDDKKDIIGETKSSAVSAEKSLPIENIKINTLVPNMPSPIIPESVLCKSKTNNMEDFNFPKFSTPTSGSFLCNSSENLASLSVKPIEENLCISDDIKNEFKSIEGISTAKKTFEDNNHVVFNTSHISSILGKGLSTVLDAHYESPKKSISIEKRHSEEKNVNSAHKRRKLFSDSDDNSTPPAEMNSNIKSHNLLKDISENSKDADKDDHTDGLDLDSIEPFHSDSFSDVPKSPPKTLSDAKPQITETINEMVNKVCDDSNAMCLDLAKINDENTSNEFNKNVKVDSELLIVPETEGLFLSKDEDFLESLTFSQHLNDCNVKDNLLNASSQSRLESPVVNQIVAAVKKSVQNSNFSRNTIQSEADRKSSVGCSEKPNEDNVPKLSDSSFENSFVIDTSCLEDGSQMLGNYKNIPFNNEKNIQESNIGNENKVKSNLNFICSLGGASNEAVIDVEIVKFNNFMYAFIQHKTQIHVWRQENKQEWIKIFNHQVENRLTLVKICVTMDDDNLITVLLLSNEEQYCLQFLLFEKDASIIKLMENTHWLEERHADDSVLLCSLDKLMFATAQVKDCHEVSLHAFICLKDCPRLMTAVLGLTDNILCSLCKIKNLPNALLGISESVLYVWHIMEARLVTSVSLHPCNYLPFQQCFWATVENGLIFMLTTCKHENELQVCQLLAVNLATGFCQVVMTYSTQPSGYKVTEITKAVYREPFIVVSHSNGALLWTVSEEYCCAALLSKSDVTSVAICEDFENWGLVSVGSKRGFISCYGLEK